ncbi:NAD(P)H-dependent oxidoreductase subunit E [Propionivibrio sp.]|uniref:NADH-quinone oxidoreductase subunit NuoE family protein n=1 Tax=Propionivibrio sp. TaxID=2212460 RepID=UPI00345901D7
MGASSHCDYLDPILNRYRHRPDCLLQMLREGQEQFGYVHPDAIDYLSEKLKLPRARVEGVASFYSFLHLQPCGKYRVLFSDNITDRMLGNQTLLERMCRNLWVERGKVSEDGLVSIDYTSCTGMCDQGPAVLVNGQALTGMTTERIDRICELIRVPVLPLTSNGSRRGRHRVMPGSRHAISSVMPTKANREPSRTASC